MRVSGPVPISFLESEQPTAMAEASLLKLRDNMAITNLLAGPGEYSGPLHASRSARFSPLVKSYELKFVLRNASAASGQECRPAAIHRNIIPLFGSRLTVLNNAGRFRVLCRRRFDPTTTCKANKPHSRDFQSRASEHCDTALPEQARGIGSKLRDERHRRKTHQDKQQAGPTQDSSTRSEWHIIVGGRRMDGTHEHQ
jgi:hypothetical protein